MRLRINLLLTLTLLFVIQCKEEEKQTKNLVKIGESVLTEEKLNAALGEFQNQAKFREEYINNWIEREVLFREAEKSGILEDEQFNSVLERSRRELAASILLGRYLEENEYEPAAEEIKKFFVQYIEDFKLSDDAYKINMAFFGNKETAIKFRSILIESDWKKAINAFKGDGALISSESDKLIYIYQVQPASVSKIIENLLPGEISIVHQAEPKSFVIVQLIENYEKGSTPALEIVQDKVKDRLVILRNKEVIRSYIDKLIDDHKIEIKRYTE